MASVPLHFTMGDDGTAVLSVQVSSVAPRIRYPLSSSTQQIERLDPKFLSVSIDKPFHLLCGPWEQQINTIPWKQISQWTMIRYFILKVFFATVYSIIQCNALRRSAVLYRLRSKDATDKYSLSFLCGTAVSHRLCSMLLVLFLTWKWFSTFSRDYRYCECIDLSFVPRLEASVVNCILYRVGIIRS
jgi:hypothetical protein